MATSRLILNAAGSIADNVVSMTFPPPTQGFGYQLSVSVPSGVSSQLWTVALNGLPIGGMIGATPFGPLFMVPNDQLAVSGAWTSGPPAPSAVAVGVVGSLGEVGPTSPLVGG